MRKQEEMRFTQEKWRAEMERVKLKDQLRNRSWKAKNVEDDTADTTHTTSISIMRAQDGSVGLKFARPVGVKTGPFEVTRLVPGSAAHLSGVVRAGNFFCAVNGRDVCALTSEDVKVLFFGPPGHA